MQPIFVTGLHRGGTTWVGKMLSINRSIHYINEPFNIAVHTDSPLKYWYHAVKYLEDHERRQFDDYFSSFFSMSSTGVIRDFRIGLRYGVGNALRRLTARPLIKDPIALFSAEYIQTRYSTMNVVVLRHPAAFIASIKQKQWEFDFINLLSQRELINNLLIDYRDQIEQAVSRRLDIIAQGVLFWNIANAVIDRYRINNKDGNWIFCTHESLSSDPVAGFKELYLTLGIHFTTKVEKAIIEATDGRRFSAIERNSRLNIKEWKNRLSEEEIGRIREGTLILAGKLYSAEDW